MKNLKFVNEIRSKYQLSNKNFGILFGVNAATVHRWKHGEMEISSGNIENIKSIDQGINLFMKKTRCSLDATVKLALTLKETKIWQGIDHMLEHFANINVVIPSGHHLKSYLLQNLDLIEKKLTTIPPKVSHSKIGTDIICKDRDGNYVGIVIFEKSVRQDNFTKMSIVTENLITQFGDEVRCLVIAQSFSPLFIQASKRLPNLISVELNIKTKKVTKGPDLF